MNTPYFKRTIRAPIPQTRPGKRPTLQASRRPIKQYIPMKLVKDKK